MAAPNLLDEVCKPVGRQGGAAAAALSACPLSYE